MIPNFSDYRWVVVNSSAGKDSMAALIHVLARADRQGYPRSQIVVSHQDLGRMEWKGTKELAARQAEAYGLRFEVTRYHNKDGAELTLLDYVRKRGKWPSNKQRYCTSDFKRGPGRRLLTRLSREACGSILHVFGFRAEESPARAKKNPFILNASASSHARQVYDWLPIHEWKETEVWAHIAESRLRDLVHPAYALGMPRLSCVFCIFAPRAALMIAGRNNPELLAEYCTVEREIGHDFQHGKPLADIQRAIAAGEQVGAMDGKWNM